ACKSGGQFLVPRISDTYATISKPDDFLCSSTGMFVLGGVCMQLIFVGETVKVIDGKFPNYLCKYPVP
ncbi:MAG: hypothetical protein ACI37U_02770, partial [Bacteroides sp.]